MEAFLRTHGLSTNTDEDFSEPGPIINMNKVQRPPLTYTHPSLPPLEHINVTRFAFSALPATVGVGPSLPLASGVGRGGGVTTNEPGSRGGRAISCLLSSAMLWKQTMVGVLETSVAHKALGRVRGQGSRPVGGCSHGNGRGGFGRYSFRSSASLRLPISICNSDPCTTNLNNSCS